MALYEKILLLLIIVYALSPVAIISDFIPLLGYLDDLVILLLGIYRVFKLIPEEVKTEYRGKAISQVPGSNLTWLGLAVIIFVWLLVVLWIIVVFSFSPLRHDSLFGPAT